MNSDSVAPARPTKTREILNYVLDSTRWNGFEFRDDDVVIGTWSKTGTTLTQQIVAQLVFNGEPGVFGDLDPLRNVAGRRCARGGGGRGSGLRCGRRCRGGSGGGGGRTLRVGEQGQHRQSHRSGADTPCVHREVDRPNSHPRFPHPRLWFDRRCANQPKRKLPAG